MKLKQKRQLEKRMLSFKELAKIQTKNSRENFVWLEPQSGVLASKYEKLDDMKPLLGNKIAVRKTVKQKLVSASKQIFLKNKSWRLLVTYGYRSPEIQNKYFQKELAKNTCKGKINAVQQKQLYEAVHRKIAVPAVAGHPTGGAVDVCLIDVKNQLINCGSTLYNLDDSKRYTFAPIKPNEKIARFTLRSAMMRQGFAPFDGEWWHFSYGDKEWAAYYKKTSALYNQVCLDFVQSTLKYNL